MHLRIVFVVAFFMALSLMIFLSLNPSHLVVVDKVLHVLVFYWMTCAFYWIMDTTPQQATIVSLIICTVWLGTANQILISLIQHDRLYDVYNPIANVFGSLASLAFSVWCHQRLLKHDNRMTGILYGPSVKGPNWDLERQIDLHQIDPQENIDHEFRSKHKAQIEAFSACVFEEAMKAHTNAVKQYRARKMAAKAASTAAAKVSTTKQQNFSLKLHQ